MEMPAKTRQRRDEPFEFGKQSVRKRVSPNSCATSTSRPRCNTPPAARGAARTGPTAGVGARESLHAGGRGRVHETTSVKRHRDDLAVRARREAGICRQLPSRLAPTAPRSRELFTRHASVRPLARTRVVATAFCAPHHTRRSEGQRPGVKASMNPPAPVRIDKSSVAIDSIGQRKPFPCIELFYCPL